MRDGSRRGAGADACGRPPITGDLRCGRANRTGVEEPSGMRTHADENRADEEPQEPQEPQETPCQSVLLFAVHAKKGPVRLSCLSTRLPRDRHSGVSAEEQGSGRSTRDCAHSTRDGQGRERRGPGLESIGFVKKRPPALSLRPRHPTSIASSVLKIGNAHSVQYLLTATGPRSEPSHRWPLTSATSATCGTCGRAKPFGP